MSYIVFIATLLFLFLLCLRIFRNDFFSPPIIMLCIFILCSLVGLLRYNEWNIADYSLKSVILLLVGISSFIFASTLALKYYKEKTNNIIPIRRNRINIPDYFVILSLLFGCVTLYIFIQNMKHVLEIAGSEDGNITHIIAAYHWYVTHEPEKFKVPARVLYCLYVLTVNSILFLFVSIHNYVFRVFKNKDYIYVVCVLFWPVVSILNSSRYELLCMMSIIIYLLYFFENMYYGNSQLVRKKIIKFGCKLLLAFLVFFIFLTIYMGRRQSFSDLEIKNYLTIYISAGIRNFDLFVNSPPDIQGWGKETFPSIYRFLYNHFGIGGYYKIPLEYRSINGQNMGNIFTCFRRYYSDFGLGGLILVPFMFGFFITCLYYKTKTRCKRNVIGFELLVFAYLSRCVFFMPIEDYFFIFDVSARGIFKIMVLYVLYRLFIKKKTVNKTMIRNA